MDQSNLELGIIGNCTFNALVDRQARIVWSCFPRPDGDPVFCSLVDDSERPMDERGGYFSVELEDFARSEQRYLDNTAILVTTLWDSHGNCAQVTDFAPRFSDLGRTFRPLLLVRRVEPVEGSPRIRVRVRPRFGYGAMTPLVTRGSNHVRYVDAMQALRLTTDMPITYVLDETTMFLDRPVNMLFGADETLGTSIAQAAREYEERTAGYWRFWVRPLAVPLEWQDAVIRAAITLKLCTFEETGAVVAAMTTSLPEAQGTERNWDYRYCWLRDAFFVIRALNSLSEVVTMENYLGYLLNVGHDASRRGHLQPVYGIGLEARLAEGYADALHGYRGHRPVRIGNQAYEHLQHDVYGNVVLATTQAFFDARLLRRAGKPEFERLQWVGERAFALHDQPDAGIWEYRTRARVHTSSSIMCWAACDRLAKIAGHLGLPERQRYWQQRADQVHGAVLQRAWSEERQAFVESFEGEALDASVLLMGEVGFLPQDDPRWRKTVEAVGRELKHGSHLYRYVAADDFGRPKTAFLACTFWYIDALMRTGRVQEARESFEQLLAQRNALGILSEDIDTSTGELWGNYPQTYSMAGIINCAIRLSRRWESVL